MLKESIGKTVTAQKVGGEPWGANCKWDALAVNEFG